MLETSGESELERRLRLLEDERAILRTLHRYPHAIDSGDAAAAMSYAVVLVEHDGAWRIELRIAEVESVAPAVPPLADTHRPREQEERG